MHEFLRSIGLRSLHTKEELRRLTEWVTEAPEDMAITDAGADDNVAEATRFFAGGAGVTVVGSVREDGSVIPEYYFPCLKTDVISSDKVVNVDRLQTREGFAGMCDDPRVGTPLIFNVRNVVDAERDFEDNEFETAFHSVSFGMLLSDATIVLPLIPEARMTEEKREEMDRRREEAMREAETSPEAFSEYAKNAIDEYERFLYHMQNTDILSMVDSFLMPYGLESECYYILGTILSEEDYFNELTGERYYRMTVEVNGITLSAVVNEADLTGIPQEGCRIRAHGWLQGFVS